MKVLVLPKMDKQKIFGQNKILNHPEKIKNWLNRGEDTLITAEIDMTNLCNNRCPHCTGWYPKKTQDSLTIKEAKSYIKQLKDAGAKALIFTGGGEPLVNPKTLEAVIYAGEIGFDIGFITNGMAMNNEMCWDILLRNCDWIRISLDAGTPGMYKKTHGMEVSDFFQVIKNIKGLV